MDSSKPLKRPNTQASSMTQPPTTQDSRKATRSIPQSSPPPIKAEKSLSTRTTDIKKGLSVELDFRELTPDESIAFKDFVHVCQESIASSHQHKKLLIYRKTGHPVLLKRVHKPTLYSCGMSHDADSCNSAVVEAAAGKLLFLGNGLINSQPDYSLIEQQKDPAALVGVDYIANSRPLLPSDFTTFRPGLANLLVTSLLLEESDLKLDNIHINNQSGHFFRFDTEWCFQSLRGTTEDFTRINARRIDNLPKIPSGYPAIHFLDSEQGDQTRFSIPRENLEALQQDSNFQAEKWNTALIWLLMPQAAITSALDETLPEDLVANKTISNNHDAQETKVNIQATFFERIDQLKAACLQSHSFREHVLKLPQTQIAQLIQAIPSAELHQSLLADFGKLKELCQYGTREGQSVP